MPRLRNSAPTPKTLPTKVKDEASFKTVFPEVQKNCGGCHQTYRKRQS